MPASNTGISETPTHHTYGGISYDMDIAALKDWSRAHMDKETALTVHTEDTSSHLIFQGALPFGAFTVDYLGAGYLGGVLQNYYPSIEEASLLGISRAAPDFAAQYADALDGFMALYQFLVAEYGPADRIVLRQGDERTTLSIAEAFTAEALDRMFSQADGAGITIRIGNILLWYSQYSETVEGQKTLALITALHFYGPQVTTDLADFM